jgi:hypothetical protein
MVVTALPDLAGAINARLRSSSAIAALAGTKISTMRQDAWHLPAYAVLIEPGRGGNRKHGYMTLMCVERPFSGIAEGLWAYFQTVGTPEALKRMTPAEKRRLDQVTRYFAPPGDVLPDIATLHPRFARGMRVPERDALTGAVPLGILDEIPASLAQRYVTRINAAGLKPPLVLPGLTA